MKKMLNQATIGGKLYAVNLEERVSKKNIRYIGGDISVATNPEMSNIIKVTYIYVPETQKNFSIFKKLVDGAYETVETDGAERAANIIIRGSSIALNEFINRDGELVSVKRFEGGIPTILSSNIETEYVNEFDVDMLITNARMVEATSDNEQDKVIIKGACFNFRNELLPIEFVVKDEKGINCITDFNVSNSNPLFIEVLGTQISQVYETSQEKPTMFGEPVIRTVRRNVKEFLVTNFASDPYPWDDEGTLLATEVSEKSAERELKLATLKQEHETYLANKSNPAKELFNTANKTNAPKPNIIF